MSKEFSEDKLIQASAAELLEKELGWTAVYAFDEVLGLDGTLGRTSYKQVLLPGRFAQALKSLNPWMTGQQVTEAIERMTEYMSSQTLMQINEQNVSNPAARPRRSAPRSLTLPRLGRTTSCACGSCGCRARCISAVPTSWALSTDCRCCSWS